jgi:hypothetical protein
MKKVTVNLLVEISENGQTNTYKASSGAQFTHSVLETDIVNLVNLSRNQIISQGIQDSIVAFSKSDTVAQDAYISEGD